MEKPEGETGIVVENMSKIFRSYRKESGWKGTWRGLWKRDWIQRHALSDVSIRIRPGEIVGLVGANGAGKTTLVKCLTGIIPPDSGRIHVNGFVPSERPYAFRRQIALVMGQKAQLWWDLPALDCFDLLRRIYTIPRPVFDRNLAILSDALHVGDTIKVPIRRLSLGERMKMEIMAALLHDPQVIFLDEPTIGLDLDTQQNIRKFLQSYAAERKPIIILTSHYMEDIASVCQRLLLVSEGKLVYDGPLSSVYQRFPQEKLLTIKVLPDAGLSGSVLFEAMQGKMAQIGLDTAVVKQMGEWQCQTRIPPEYVRDVAREMLERFVVADISIEEDDVSTIIQRMMHEARGQHAPAQ